MNCHFCGLPVPQTVWGPRPSKDDDLFHYCCYGCRLAESITGKTGEQGQVNATLVRLGLAIFFTMNVMVFSLALWSQDYVSESETESLAPVLWGLFRYICMLFAMPVFFLLAGPLAENAVEDLRQRVITTDQLLVVGVAAAFIYSAIAVFTETGHVYFEVGCMILVMVTLGRWLEAQGKVQTTEAIQALSKLLPETARLVTADGHEEQQPLDAIDAGQTVRVRPGETIPFDGIVLDHPAEVDEQILTGESFPQQKQIGDGVYAGTMNLGCELTMQVTAGKGAGAVARMVELVRQACQSKGRYQRLADRIVAYFIPTVIVLAIGTFIAHTAYSGFEPGLKAGLSVVLIACPCALGLATPMAVWASLGLLTRYQTLCRSGEALERLASVRCVRFDKTGTLTTGAMEVSGIHLAAGMDRDEALGLAGMLAARSNHPSSTAIARSYQVNSCAPSNVTFTEVVHHQGLGLRATTDNGESVLLGSERFVRQNGSTWADTALQEAYEGVIAAGSPAVCLAVGQRIVAIFALHEELREDARQAIDALGEYGLDVAVFTGDHAKRAAIVAKSLGVDVKAQMLPEEKLARLQQGQRQWGAVAMIGDGVNDAPALAAADVGIAMGCGADISRQSADICLLSNDLSRIPWMIGVARRTVRVIRQNLFWAFAYNVIAVGFAVTGRLNPALAASAMVLSSALVVVNSLRLRESPMRG